MMVYFRLFLKPVHLLLPQWIVSIVMIPSGWNETPELLVTRKIDLALWITKFILGFVFIAIYWRIFMWIKKINQDVLFEKWISITLLILGAFFLLSPTLQPWYLLWLLPILCLTINSFFLSNTTTRKNVSDIDKTYSLIHRLYSQFSHEIEKYSNRKNILIACWFFSMTVFLSYWILENYLKLGLWQEIRVGKMDRIWTPAYFSFLSFLL